MPHSSTASVGGASWNSRATAALDMVNPTVEQALGTLSTVDDYSRATRSRASAASRAPHAQGFLQDSPERRASSRRTGLRAQGLS